jgi:phosphoserine phosphatase RsbX
MKAAPATIECVSPVEWGTASRTLAGESVSGDIAAVVPTVDGVVVAAVDGLGHGREAAAVAEIAAATVKTYAEEPPASIVMRCHEALRRTRGVAISIASFDVRHETMTWTGIGNVEGTLLRAASGGLRAREALLLRGGVVGYSIPQPRIATLSVARGDTLIFATDGVASGFKFGLLPGRPVQNLADDILLRHGRRVDDALVLAVRYIGAS